MRVTEEWLLNYAAEKYNLYDMGWMWADYFKIIENFKEKYTLRLPLIFIAALSIDFMNQRMDCASCEIDESYFEEFYSHIKELLKSAEKDEEN